MKTFTQLQRSISLTVIVVFLSSSVNSYAQTPLFPKPLTTGFLSEFAQKLADRGEVQEAQALLKKILKSDSEYFR